MAEREHHRKPRYLRAIAIIAWALQGLLTPWTQTPAYAANPDTLAVKVRAGSTTSPLAVTDLLASPSLTQYDQISLTWTSPQGYGDIPGAAVDNYSIHYATFSVDSLLGNTTSWWNATQSSSITLQAPAYTPQSPGNLEAYVISGLLPDTTYYFALRSLNPSNVLSPVDTQAATPTQQVFAKTSPSILPPTSFTGVALSTGSIRWTWTAVSSATSYEVYSHPANVLLQTISAPTTSWIEPSLSVNTAYTRKVRAADLLSTTPFSSVATVYSAAEVPSGFAFGTITSNTMQLTWNANGNPAGTPFALERSLDGVSFTTVSTTTATNLTQTGLAVNTTHYFRLRAINGDSVPTAYTSTIFAATLVATNPPRFPNGVLSTSISNGLQTDLIWTPVTRDVNGDPVTVANYMIQRFSVIGGTPTSTVMLPANARSYSDANAGVSTFYRIQAISSGGAVSSPSDYLDSSGNRYALASDDIATRVIMPNSAASALLAANNPYGEDLDIVITHQPQDEVNVTLRSYKVQARITATNQLLTQFTFPQNNISIELGYQSVITPSQGGPVTIGSQTNVSAAALAQILSVYWYNGSSYVRIGNPLLTLNQSISVTVRNLGIYQIRAVTIASKFRLSQGSPYPRVITPNGAENRRVFWFFENPTGDSVGGDIYDIRGAHVRTLGANSQSPTANSLVWDGRDKNGAVVPSGVYLYKISTSDEVITGTVVVAR